MNKVELIAQQLANSINVRNIWGDVIINVKESPYNAIGNGVKDDTVAIQKAVNYANSIGKHDIWMPPGTYKYTTISNTGNITFYGDYVNLVGVTFLEVVSFHSMVDRIDNIVAGAGSSNTEIVDARLPATGSSYPTLKTRLDTENANVNASIAAHEADTTAHNATAIVFTPAGSGISATNVDGAIKEQESRIDNLIIHGDSGPEAADARVSTVKGKTFTVLKDRLEESETELIAYKADYAKHVPKIFDVTGYGAIGDGVTDNATAILAAISDMPNGGILYLPKGTYKTTAQLPYVSNLVIKGEGYNKSIIQYTGTASITAFIDATTNGLTLQDIRISGNYASNPTQTCHGVYLHTLSGQTGGHFFDNVYIDNFGGHGFYLGPNVYMCIFTTLRLYENGMSGLYVTGTDTTFSNVHAQGNKQHGIALIGGNNRLHNYNCIFNGQSGIAYAGYYQSAWNCQVSNGQCQDNYYHGFIFDGARKSTLSSLESDANGYAFTSAVDTNITAYGFVFKNSCNSINGTIQAINYRSTISCIAGMTVDSSCNNINLKYEEYRSMFQQRYILNSSLTNIDTTSDYQYRQTVKSGKTLHNIMINPNFTTTATGLRLFQCSSAVSGNILTSVSTAVGARLQLTDTKVSGHLYYSNFKIRAALGAQYKIFVFKDDANAPAFDNIIPNNNIYTGTGDWQSVSVMYFLNNALSTAYYPTVGFLASGQSIDVKESCTVDLTADFGFSFSRTTTQVVDTIDFMDRILSEKGWFASTLVLS